MYGVQLGPDKHILLARIENELIINVDGTVKKIKFSTTHNTTEKCYDLLFDTGRGNTENNTPIYIETDYFITLGILSPLSTYEFDVNLIIKAGDQVFVGYDSGPDSDMIVFAGMDPRTSQDKSYYWSISKDESDILQNCQSYDPFYVESIIETDNIDISDVRSEITKINEANLLLQNEINNP
jgi:hypothetical protein